LIMDTLAALALATEPPREELLDRKPYSKDDYMISRVMMKHIIGQAIYQVAVTMVIVFAGDYFIPEFLTPSENLPAYVIYSPESHDDIHFVRSGRFFDVSSGNPDYYNLYLKYGPSRHFTMVFNTFVMLQIFNFFSARRLNDEFNIFEGVLHSRLFCIIVFLILAGQLILGNVGGWALGVSLHYMDVRQWLIAVAFGFGGWVVDFLLKLLPKNMCPTAGKEKADPFHQKSIVTSLKRPSNEIRLQRKLSNPNPMRRNSSLIHGNSRQGSLGSRQGSLKVNNPNPNVAGLGNIKLDIN